MICWNTITGRMTRPTWPANKRVAIGTPLARLFFDPQNTMVISSAREKPSRRLAKVRIVITAVSREWFGSA